MVDFLEGRLSTDSELSNSWFFLETWHVVDHCFDFVGIEVDALHLEGRKPAFYLIVGLENTFFSAL